MSFFHHFRKLPIEAISNLSSITQIAQAEYISRLLAEYKISHPKSLIPYGYKLYSQNDEDGIIAEIFRRIKTTNKIFVEFGVGNGLENNTLALLFQNWHGLWIEASRDQTRKIMRGFKKTIERGALSVTNDFVTTENINDLISNAIHETEIDLLSIDIDGNDFHIMSAIKCISPRVIVIEYNAKFPPPIEYCMKYNPSYTWNQSDCFGASLKFLENNLRNINYVLVGCNISGANAFFIRKDLISDNFAGPFTAENYYEPPRYFISKWISGHPAIYSTLEEDWLQND